MKTHLTHTLIALLVLCTIGCSIELYEWQTLNQLSYVVPEIERFGYRVAVTLDNSSAEDFIDFPVLVRLDGSNIPLAHLNSTAQIGIYSADLSTKLSYEIENWNPESDCNIWIKVPSILAGSAAQFYIYYGYSSTVPLSSHDTNVWTDNFLGVWHFNESSGTSYADSSPGHFNGGLTGNTQSYTAPTPTAGRIGGGQLYDDVTDGIAAPPVSTTSVGAAPFTISMWTNLSSVANAKRFFDKGGPGAWGFDARTINSGDIQVEIKAASESFPDFMISTIDTNIGINNWDWWCFTHDGTFTTVDNDFFNFRNASNLSGSTGGTNTGNGSYHGDAGAYFHIGCANYNVTDGFNGIIDEVRISSVQRSQSWITAQYQSMTQDPAFITYGPEEEMSY